MSTFNKSALFTFAFVAAAACNGRALAEDQSVGEKVQVCTANALAAHSSTDSKFFSSFLDVPKSKGTVFFYNISKNETVGDVVMGTANQDQVNFSVSPYGRQAQSGFSDVLVSTDNPQQPSTFTTEIKGNITTANRILFAETKDRATAMMGSYQECMASPDRPQLTQQYDGYTPGGAK